MAIRSIRLLILVFVLIISANARAAGDGDLLMLGVAVDQQGEAGAWAQVGPKAAWKDTIAGVVVDGKLFTVENNGKLWRTDLETGAWKQIGKPEFGDTQFMFTAGGKIYTVEKSGHLYRVSPDDGTWEPVAKTADWKLTLGGAVINNALYSVESNGGLWETDLETGKWQQIGNAEFQNTRFIFAADNLLYTIEKDGGLYRVNPRDGSWSRVGTSADWKSILAGAIIRDQLYTVDANGSLYFTDLRTGDKKSIGKADYQDTRFMFPSTSGALCTIEASGNLYRVQVKAGPSIDCFNWCTDEMEKVFKEQGKDFYKQMQIRHVLGEKVTHAAVMEGLAWLAQKATAKDTVVIYIGAHGQTDPKKGWSISTIDGKRFWGSELKKELAKLPCPVLLLLETCTSGGFAEKHEGDPAVPPNVMAICACAPNQATNNQLDMAVLEALYGRADFDKDGVINVEELSRYVELRYKEWWPGTKTVEGSQTPVIVRSEKLEAKRPLTRISPALSAVAFQNKFYSALLEKQIGDRYQIHFLGWSSRAGEPYFLADSVARDSICLPADGPPLEVLVGGHWVAARSVKKEDGKEIVRILGKDREVTVPQTQTRYPFVGKPPGK